MTCKLALNYSLLYQINSLNFLIQYLDILLSATFRGNFPKTWAVTLNYLSHAA